MRGGLSATQPMPHATRQRCWTARAHLSLALVCIEHCPDTRSMLPPTPRGGLSQRPAPLQQLHTRGCERSWEGGGERGGVSLAVEAGPTAGWHPHTYQHTLGISTPTKRWALSPPLNKTASVRVRA